MKLYHYIKPDGSFDYELYKKAQIKGNRRKLDSVWVLEENVAFLARYIKAVIGRPERGICHGTRRGKEQEWFQKYLNCEVIGTEISDTATQFPNTIQWDFHETKPEWIDSVDFIYSNSLDHSYDPEKCLNAWMSCVKENGVCIIEHTSKHERINPVDSFGAQISQMPQLIASWGKANYYVHAIVEAPAKPDVSKYAHFIVIKRHPVKQKMRTPRKVFIDCGAYTGNSVQKFLSAFEGFEIYSFEPNPLLAQYHRGLCNTLINKAVWIENGWIDFYLDQGDYDGSSVFEHKTNIVGKKKITVPTVDFSQWLKQHFTKDDFIILKMDIEGAEYNVLNKMIEEGTIQYIDELMIEFHGHKIGQDPREHQRLLCRLKEYNIAPVDWNAIFWDQPGNPNPDLAYLKTKYPAYTRQTPSDSETRNYIDSNVTVVVRSVGERTESMCYERVKTQIAEQNIHLIREKPFTEAVRKTFQIGLQESRKWTLALDADVLLVPDALQQLIAFAETLNDSVYTVIGPLVDKFLESPRPVGYHLYRTQLMQQAIDYIPSPYDAIRPETFVVHEMEKSGFPYVQTGHVIGIHDFGQSYHDIYRKCFVHARKHSAKVLRALPRWHREAEKDPDFKVALAAYQMGLKYSDSVAIDVDAPFMQTFETIMKTLGLSEKPSFEPHPSTSNIACAKAVTPALSVIMTAFNSERFIGETIESVLAQSVGDFELLVVDDGSTDDTVSIVESYNDARIRLMRQPHKNFAAAMNRGIQEARGEFVMTVDSDDRIEPEYFSQLTAFANAHPNFDYYYPEIFTLIDEKGHIGDAPWRYRDFEDSQTLLAFLFINGFSPVPNPGSLKRRALFERTGLYGDLERVVDYEYLTRTALNIRFKRADGVSGYLYRVRPDSISRQMTPRNTITADAMEAMLTRYSPEILCPSLKTIAPDQRQAAFIRYVITVLSAHAKRHAGRGGEFYVQAARRIQQRWVADYAQTPCQAVQPTSVSL